MKVRVTICLNGALLKKIDLERKLVSRSAYIEFLLKKILEGENAK